MESVRASIGKIGELLSLERNQRIVLLAVLLLWYGSTLGNGFVHDDRAAIVTNEYLHSGQYWYKTFTGCMGEYQLGGCDGKGFYYRPMKLLSDFVAYQISSSPWIFHFFNLAYTYILCLVLLRFYNFFLEKKALAFFGVLIFLTHPINSEVINWIAAVQDILLAIFLLLALKWYIRYSEEGEEGALLRSGAFWLAAMFSKETAVFFGIVFASCEIFQKRRLKVVFESLVRNYRLVLFYTVPVLVYFSFRYAVLGTFFANDYARTTENLPPTTHALTSLWLFGTYILKLFWSLPLNLFHSINVNHFPVSQLVFSGLLLLGFLAMLFIFFRKKQAAPFIGVLWWLTLIAPPIVFIGSLGNNVLYERYVFVPLAGLILASIYGVEYLMQRQDVFFERLSVRITLFVIIVAYLGATWKIDIDRNRDFKDNISLYTASLALSPNEVDLYYNLALSYAEVNDTSNAMKNYQKVVELEPTNYKAHNNLGSLYLASNDFVSALREYKLAIELNPSLFSLYYNLANAYIQQNDSEKALEALDKALELNPNFAQAKQKKESLIQGYKEDESSL